MAYYVDKQTITVEFLGVERMTLSLVSNYETLIMISFIISLEKI